jgi:hypothetical protein
MGIMNKRNAVLGWAVWKVGKRVVPKRAKSLVPGRAGGTSRPNKSAIALAVAGIVGALTFWRKQRGEDQQAPKS